MAQSKNIHEYQPRITLPFSIGLGWTAAQKLRLQRLLSAAHREEARPTI